MHNHGCVSNILMSHDCKKKERLFRGEECNKIGGTPKPTMQAYPLNIFIHISTTFSHP